MVIDKDVEFDDVEDEEEGEQLESAQKKVRASALDCLNVLGLHSWSEP